MKLASLITTFILAIFSSQFAIAGSTEDALWNRVVAQNNEIKKWAAKEIEQIVIANKDGEPSKTVIIKKSLTGWEKNKPNYVILSTIPPENSKSSKPFDFSEFFAPIESEIFSDRSIVRRTDGQTLNGQAVVLFEIAQSDTLVKVWVDGNSGALQKRIVEIKVPFIMEGNLTTNYQLHTNGQTFPKNAETKVSIKMPFKKARVEIKDVYTNWTAQP